MDVYGCFSTIIIITINNNNFHDINYSFIFVHFNKKILIKIHKILSFYWRFMKETLIVCACMSTCEDKYKQRFN